MVWIEAGVRSVNPKLELVSSEISGAQLRVDGCGSGFSYFGDLKSLKLYNGDKDCLARLTQFRLDGVDFFAPANGSAAAGTTLIYRDKSLSKSVLVSTIFQLSSPLTAVDHIEFRAGFVAEGKSSTFILTTVSLVADADVVVEGPGAQINVTISRDQSFEPLSVALEFTGDGADRMKGIDVPTQVDFAVGQSKKVLSWTVPSNELGENDQTLDFAITEGPYIVGLQSSAEIQIQDAAPKITLLSQYQSNQDVDLNLTVSADAGSLKWETTAGPSILTFYQNLGKTYAKAQIEGDYDILLTATGVNGKVTSAGSHIVFDLNPPRIDELQLASFLGDGWLSNDDSLLRLPLMNPVTFSDKSTTTLSYSLMLAQTECGKTLNFVLTIPKSDDTGLVPSRGLRICVKAQDSFGWTSFASTLPFSYQTFVPTAVLSNLPKAISSDPKASIGVAGQGVVSYRYALIDAAASCNNGAVYGADSTEAQISLDLLAFDNKDVRLCVVAKAESGNTQSFLDATSYKWRVDLSAPQPITSLSLTSLSERIKISYPASASDSPRYLVLRSDFGDIDFAPVSGQIYAVGTQRNGWEVLYAGLKAELFDNRLGNSNAATYAVYVYDDAFNYSSAFTGTQSAIGTLPLNIAQGFDRTLRGGVKRQKIGSNPGFYAYGDFIQFGNIVGINRIARFDGSGKIDTSFVTGIINGSIYSIAEDNKGRIYIGGSFTKIGTVDCVRVARLLANGNLDTSFVTTAGPNGNVMALELDERAAGQERLYAGGAITAFGTRSVGRLVAMTLTGALDANYSTAMGSGFNNTIYSLKVIPNSWHMLVGGGFTAFGSSTGAGATRLSKLTLANHTTPAILDPTFTIGTGPNSNVYAIELDAAGAIYAGGAFSSVNGSSNYKYMARFSPSGAIDTTFGVAKKFNAAVWALALDSVSNSIYAAGDFTLYGTASSPRLARLTLDASGTLDTGMASGIGVGFNGIVYGISLLPTGLVAGGAFSNYAGQNVPRYVRLSLSNYQPLSNQAIGSMFNAQTNTAAFGKTENEIYVGGTFTQYHEKLLNRLLRMDAQGQYDVTYLPVLNGNVNTMIYDASDSTLLIAGTFSTIGGVTQKRIARLLNNGTVDPNFFGGQKAFDSDVYILAKSGEGKIWAGGKFSTYNAAAQNKLARLLANGNLDTSFVLQGSGFLPTTATVSAIAPTADGGAFVGGSFTSYNGVSANRIVKLLADGNIDSSFVLGPGFNNVIRTMKIVNNLLYVGGDFTTYKGQAQNRVARLKLDGTLDTTFAIGTGFNGSVYSIGYDNYSGLLYFTGAFTSIQATAAGRIAALKLTGERDSAFKSTVGLDSTGTFVLPGKYGVLITGAFASFENQINGFITRLSYYGRQN